MSDRWSVMIVRIVDGLDRDEVAADLAKAWHIDRARVDEILARLPAVVKTFDDREEAVRYRNRLEDLGVDAMVEKEAEAPRHQATANVKRPDIPPTSAPSPAPRNDTKNILILVGLVGLTIVIGGFGLSRLLQRLPEGGFSQESPTETAPPAPVTPQGEAEQGWLVSWLASLLPEGNTRIRYDEGGWSVTHPAETTPAPDVTADIEPDRVSPDLRTPLRAQPDPETVDIRDLPLPAWWGATDAPAFTTVDQLLGYWRDSGRNKRQFAKAAFTLLQRNPDDGHVVMTVANLYPHADPDYPQMEALLRTALDRFPDHRLIEYGSPADTVAGVTRHLAEWLVRQGRPAEAVTLLERFLAAREGETNDQLLEHIALLRAKGLVRSGRTNEAILVLGVAIEKYHGDWEDQLVKAKKQLEGRG